MHQLSRLEHDAGGGDLRLGQRHRAIGMQQLHHMGGQGRPRVGAGPLHADGSLRGQHTVHSPHRHNGIGGANWGRGDEGCDIRRPLQRHTVLHKMGSDWGRGGGGEVDTVATWGVCRAGLPPPPGRSRL
jgi:hypothetical protein